MRYTCTKCHRLFEETVCPHCKTSTVSRTSHGIFFYRRAFAPFSILAKILKKDEPGLYTI